MGIPQPSITSVLWGPVSEMRTVTLSMAPPKINWSPGLSAARSCAVSGPPGPIMIATFGPSSCTTLGPPSQPYCTGRQSRTSRSRSIVHKEKYKELSLGWLKCDKRSVMNSIFSKRPRHVISIRLEFNRRTFYFNSDHPHQETAIAGCQETAIIAGAAVIIALLLLYCQASYHAHNMYNLLLV